MDLATEEEEETIGHRPKLFATKFRYDICRQLLGGQEGREEEGNIRF